MGNYYKFGRRKLFITSAIEANAFSPHNTHLKSILCDLDGGYAVHPAMAVLLLRLIVVM